jgi:hypothetical protein
MTKGVPDCPHPRLQRLELNVSHEKRGSLTLEDVVAPITFGPPQVEGIGESGGLPRRGCMDNLTSFSLCFPNQHYWWVFYPLYPSFTIFTSLWPAGWPLGSSIARCVYWTS